MRKYSLVGVFLLLFISGLASATGSDKRMDLETSVCGIKEPILFWLWSHAAGSADSKRIAGLDGLDDIAFTSKDGRVLRGYRLRSRLQPAYGYLLVLQGNAILADQLIGEFIPYARAGYDVYMYDYRGYGRSQGRRRLQAMVSDVQQLLAALNAKPYERSLVYAFSFGGILLLDGYTATTKINRLVIDSSPSRLSAYGCPVLYDPITHLPANCRNFLFISGRLDNVVTPAMSKDMLDLAEQRGARVVRDEQFAHPFMDPANHDKRMRLIEAFFLK